MPSAFLYYTSNAILALLALSAGLFLLVLWTSRGRLAQLRIAYLGYAVCALAITWYQLQLYASGPMASVLIGIVLVPIAVAGTAAIGNTLNARSATLRVLGASTVVAVLPLTLSGFWAVAGAASMIVGHVYALLVLAACIHRRNEWRAGTY